MRILHTADLHLGRQFNGLSLEHDHAAILAQIEAVVLDRKPDVLVIAGDIFDRASPPASAVRQFNDFVSRLVSRTGVAIAMIAGNHDSGDRIESMSVMTDRGRALVRGAVLAEETPFILGDEYGKVAFSGLPFSFEYAARACFGDETIATPEDVLAAQVAAARRHVPEGARWVVIAHAFVAGGEPSEGERPLARVGGIETVPSSVFNGAHYVALGHLHRPQEAGGAHIRYSGSPLAFGFDEAGQQKSMNLVTLGGDGHVSVEEIPFVPPRQVRVMTGRFAELAAGEPSDDFIRFVLTDDGHVMDAMNRLRAVYPNACTLSYAFEERAPEVKSLGPAPHRAATPREVIAGFLDLLRGEPLAEAEDAIIAGALHGLAQDEDAS